MGTVFQALLRREKGREVPAVLPDQEAPRASGSKERPFRSPVQKVREMPRAEFIREKREGSGRPTLSCFRVNLLHGSETRVVMSMPRAGDREEGGTWG